MEENSERAIPFRSKWTRLVAAGTAVVAISTLISVSIVVPKKVIKMTKTSKSESTRLICAKL